MRNGFGSLALLCTVASPGVAARAQVASSPRRRCARRRESPFAPFQRDLPRIPELLPVASSRTRDTTSRRSARAWPRSCPASRRRSTATRASTPGPTIRARKGREVVVRQTQRAAVRVQRAPARRLRARRARRPPDGRHPARRALRLPLPQRAGRRDALVPRPRARAHVADALLRAAGDVRARGRARDASSACRRASTTCRS